MSSSGAASGDTETGFLDGFWLPKGLREEVLRGAAWESAYVEGGALFPGPPRGAAAEAEREAGAAEAAARAGEARGVPVRWPRLTPERWSALLARLQSSRTVPGSEAATRWQAALENALPRLAEQMPAVLPLLSASTGYSQEMLAAALGAGDLIDTASLADALGYAPSWSAAARWETLPRLGGRIRFFPQGAAGRARAALGGSAPLFRPAPAVDLTLGYAAGNVPGTALMIALLGSLADHAAPGGTPAPAIVVRNSRHEPLFTPWVLSAVEEVDADLVAGLAVMIWDYDDATLQTLLFGAAGLLIAAADDGTIASLDAARTRYAPRLRFHRHGHKVSFATLGRRWTAHADAPRLAALDSSLWDQNGCLSARVHFVESEAADYARALAEEMRSLAHEIPRGATPRRFTHRAFDSYASLAGGGRVRLLTSYDDDFAVILDDRAWDAGALQRAVNRCQGRVVVVRPVEDTTQIPKLLGALPAANLQSVSVLLDEERLESFAQAVAARGVTALRGLGRAAFPQLAYSWDGLLPMDVSHLRPPGRFATMEPSTHRV